MKSRAVEIFSEAVDLPDRDRSTFLDRACGDDAELRRRVESLLAHDSAAGNDFLRAPSPGPGMRLLLKDHLPDPLIGQMLGAYTLRQTIAHGGLGTVYLAEQENPRRDVALKVLRANLWNRSAEKRFDSEAQILGYLRHPNIAQIYEAGTHSLESGATVRYFAMEYVPNARPITSYANEKALSRNERLELFLQVCDAVHHGHQKGIIHRDLKPANILVGSEDAQDRAATVRERRAALPDGRGSDQFEPLVKVIDFGIARTTDSDIAATTMHTEGGQILGTLAYMSPEQCAADPGQIDTTTDVYSLGVILYELLTGRMPYDVSNMTIQSAARIICEKEPTRPSLFERRLRGDAETIILKAIDKDRGKRFASPNDLANDIRRYLRGEPIEAKPPTAWTQAIRWAFRRPKTASALACLLMAGTVIGVTSATVYWINSRPDHLELSPDRSEARLATWQGRPLHAWNAGAIGGISFAELVERPVQYGGGRVAIIGYSSDGRNGELKGQLCAYDVNGDLTAPAWHVGIRREDLPRDLVERGLSNCDFGVTFIRPMDVFPEDTSPGLELAVVWQHNFSRRCFRIYDLSGKLLYQLWNDGSWMDAYWMSEPGVLVCAAADERVKDAFKSEGIQTGDAPLIFAIRPKYGLISNDYLRFENGDGPMHPIWHKYLHPLVLWPLTAGPVRTDGQTGALDARRHVHVNVGINRLYEDGSIRMMNGFELTLDEKGREVENTRAAGDGYEAAMKRGEFPSFQSFQLRDDPPLFAATTRPASNH